MSFECPVCNSLNDNGAIACVSCGAPLQSGDGSGATYYLSDGTLLHQNKYRIEGHLGTGGFGITYEGVDLEQSQKVAIKELWPEKAARQGSAVTWPSSIAPKERQFQLRKFQLEAEYQSRCVHPNIVKVYNWFEQNGTAYIVMEFVKGKSLYQIFETEGILSESRVKRYFIQIGEALGTVHAQNFLHRDIKPDNILVNPQDSAVLIDFGSTREFMAGQTREMSVTLTKGYAPLEQYSYRSKRWPATDFYSLCASMYELLTGELPTEAVLRVQGTPLIPPRQKNPSISPLLEKVILNGMKMKVEERFQTSSELIEALNGHFVDPSHKRARDLVKRDELAEANRAYSACLANDPDNAEAIVELAMVQIHIDVTQAKATATKAVQMAPNDGRGHGILGLLACQQADWMAAYQHLQKAVRLAPSAAWIQANFAWAAGKNNHWQEAQTASQRALSLDPNSIFTKGIQAWIACRHQQWREVIRFAKPAIFQSKQVRSANSPTLQQWLYPLLTMALEKEVKTKTINNDVDRCVREFLSLHPKSSLAWGLQGWREALGGRWSEAMKGFESASVQQSPSAWVLMSLGISHERLNNLAAAIRVYESCVKMYPNHADAYFRLGTVLAQGGNWPRAKEALEKSIELAPSHAAAHHNLAWAMLKTPGEKERAEMRQLLSMYRTAVALYEQQNNVSMANTLRAAFSQIKMTL